MRAAEHYSRRRIRFWFFRINNYLLNAVAYRRSVRISAQLHLLRWLAVETVE
jgi:hypothetical protein